LSKFTGEQLQRRKLFPRALQFKFCENKKRSRSLQPGRKGTDGTKGLFPRGHYNSSFVKTRRDPDHYNQEEEHTHSTKRLRSFSLGHYYSHSSNKKRSRSLQPGRIAPSLLRYFHQSHYRFRFTTTRNRR